MEMKESVLVNMNDSFALGDDNILRYEDQLCLPFVGNLRTKIIGEAYGSIYSINLGSTKMYHYLKQIYW